MRIRHRQPCRRRACSRHALHVGLPRGDRHERPLGGAADERRHQPVGRGQRVRTEARARLEWIRDFVEHDPHVVAASPAQPETERDVGAFPPEGVRHILHEQAMRARRRSERSCDRLQRSTAETIRKATDLDASVARDLVSRRRRRPHDHPIARVGKAARDQPRVVADAAFLGRILARQHVPLGRGRRRHRDWRLAKRGKRARHASSTGPGVTAGGNRRTRTSHSMSRALSGSPTYNGRMYQT